MKDGTICYNRNIQWLEYLPRQETHFCRPSRDKAYLYLSAEREFCVREGRVWGDKMKVEVVNTTTRSPGLVPVNSPDEPIQYVTRLLNNRIRLNKV